MPADAWLPTAGPETVDPLEFLARVLGHIPDQGHVTTRYYGWYANRPRGMRGKPVPAAADEPPATVPAPRLVPTEATRRWAALLQQIFEVDPLVCPSCHGAMRIVAVITQTPVVDQILAHLRVRAARASHAGPRSPPSTRPPASRGASRAPAGIGSPTVPAGLTALTAHERDGGYAAPRHSALARSAIAPCSRQIFSTNSRPTPIEIPIPPGGV